MIRQWTVALLAATALTSVVAPTAADAATKKKTTKTTTTAKAPAKPAGPTAMEQMQARLDALEARNRELEGKVSSLEARPAIDPAEQEAQQAVLLEQLDVIRGQAELAQTNAAKATPAFGAAPTFRGNGFSFKPTGLIQFDVGYVGNPSDRAFNGTTNSVNLGFNERARRLLFGAQGDLPGGWKYSMQFNFAQSSVTYEDLILQYAPAGKPYAFTFGYFYPYNTFDNLTSNRFVSVIERDGVTDGFNQGRRLGAGVAFDVSPSVHLWGGIFGGDIANANFDNTDWEASGRLVYNPKFGNTQLHFGANAQYRRFKNSALGFQYRERPYTQTTDVRFIDTGNIAGKGDEIYGLEFLAIHGPFHVQGEAQIDKFDGIRTGQPIDNGQAVLGTRLSSNPTFWGGFFEAGWWLTGETRGYNVREGKPDRTRIKNGFDKGGWGGFQLVGRVDFLDLRDSLTPTTPGVVNMLNGGSQLGYIAALNWWPIDYVRFTFQYMHGDVKGGPFAGRIITDPSIPVYNRNYGFDAAAVRFQVDF